MKDSCRSRTLAVAPHGFRRRRVFDEGFTLVELLVVIAIIGILVSLIFPALQVVRQSARRTQCSANLRQIILATLNYESAHHQFPPGDDGKGSSIFVPLLPHLKQEYLYERSEQGLESGETWKERLVELTELPVEPLLCTASWPEDQNVTEEAYGELTTHYYGIAGPVGDAQSSDQTHDYHYGEIKKSAYGSIGLQGLFSPDKRGQFSARRLRDIRDGSSYTFGFGEISAFDPIEDHEKIERFGWAFGAAYDSQNRVEKLLGLKSVGVAINGTGGQLNDEPFSSNHPGGAQFVLIDGAVRFVDQKVSVDILKTFCSIDEVEKPEQLAGF